MEHNKQALPEETSELESVYFELQGMFGATKHGGGLKATRELVELCHIDEDKHVLDVGCGPGLTACYIAKEAGCRRRNVRKWRRRWAETRSIEDLPRPGAPRRFPP